MVCRRMGLLDEAIREHLELKRLRGADPGLVAREEHEAFGPVSGGEPADGDHDDVGAGGDGLAEESIQPADGESEQASQVDEGHAFSNVGQETAELDMRSVLGEESGHGGGAVGPAAVGPVGDVPSTESAPTEQGADDSLEWEMPGDGESRDAAGGHAGEG